MPQPHATEINPSHESQAILPNHPPFDSNPWVQLVEAAQTVQNTIGSHAPLPNWTEEEATQWLTSQFPWLSQSHVTSNAPSPSLAQDNEPVLSIEEWTQRMAQLLNQGLVHVTHPGYLGLFNPAVLPETVLADAMVAAWNPQLAAGSHAPGPVAIEKLTLRWLMERLGIDSSQFSGHYTSGGNEANFTALLCALAHKVPDWKTQGLQGRKLKVYVSAQSHHSISKAVVMAGLGTSALETIAIDGQLAMDPYALEEQLRKDTNTPDTIPLMVVATLGTTSVGALDPVPAIAEIAHRFDLWLHVDAAWGGIAALASEAYQGTKDRVLSGLSKADSITWDAHKTMMVPMGAGISFCRHPKAYHTAFSTWTPYMPVTEETISQDLFANSLQWSRRFIGFKVFAALSTQGPRQFISRIDHIMAMGETLKTLVSGAGWQLVNETPLPIAVFQWPQPISYPEVLNQFYTHQVGWLSVVTLPSGEQAFRACITGYNTEIQHLKAILETLTSIAKSHSLV